MSGHASLNLLNELRKRDRMRDLSSILSLFPNGFNRVNNTETRMLGSFYHRTLNLNKNLILGVKTSIFCHFYVTLKSQ